MKFVFRISGGHKISRRSWGLQHWQSELNYHILNFVWKTDEGEAESIVLVIFVLWWCFNCRWVKGWWGEAESLIKDQLKSHLFPTGILAKTISMTHSDMYQLDMPTFYFYESLKFQIFVPWKFIKLKPSLVYYHFYS